MNDASSRSWRSEAVWAHVLSSFSIGPPDALHKSAYDPTIRTYLHGDLAHKIALKTDLPDLYPKLSSGAREAELLRRCDGVPGVPSVRRFRETTSACVLSMDRLQGITLQDAIGDLTAVRAFRIVLRLLRTVLALSWRGIAHNDVVIRNVVLAGRDMPCLVDFDQAHHTSRTDALLRNVLGMRTGGPSLYGSWLLVSARLAHRFLARHDAAGMPALAADASPVQRKLFHAWEVAQRVGAKTHGAPVARYSLVAEGMRLPGELSWERRWKVVRGAADFRGLRTLELGCGMGLLSTWLRKEGGASSAVGTDPDPLILSAARQVADAYSAGTSFEKIDLDASYPWERRFEPTDFDVVFVLGVFDRIRDGRRLMEFLRRFPMVVFEGGGPDKAAIERFSRAGFPVHRKLGVSDEGRGIYAFSKRTPPGT